MGNDALLFSATVLQIEIATGAISECEMCVAVLLVSSGQVLYGKCN